MVDVPDEKGVAPLMIASQNGYPGIQVPMLRLLAMIPHREIRLAKGEYKFIGSTQHGNDQKSLESYGPEGYVWLEGYGPLAIAAGVALVGRSASCSRALAMAAIGPRTGCWCRPRACASTRCTSRTA